MGIVRVNCERSRSQSDFGLDRTTLGVIHHASGLHTVNVELHRGANLLTAQHISDDAVGESVVFVGHVNSGATVCVTKTGNIRAEGHVFGLGLANGCHVDFCARNLNAPVADFSDGTKACVLNAELVGRDDRAVVGDVLNSATRCRRNRHQAGGLRIGQHVIGVGADQRGREGASTSCVGSGIPDVKLDGIANAETHVGSNENGVVGGVDIKLAKSCIGACGLIVESPGNTGQNGCHDKQGVVALAGTARLRAA